MPCACCTACGCRFQAFLVGGCVRDLLLGLEPKDFDVATDALPEQVKRLFRNCRLVGRRFRLAHVFFGREIIEVATFRAASAPSQGEEPLPDADPEDGEAPELDEKPELRRGAIRRGDERTGEAAPTRRSAGRRVRSASDDSERMFDSTDASCATTSTARSTRMSGGAISPPIPSTTTSPTSRSGTTAAASRTSRARTLRLIGDPETRFREDPVRMLRAARFEAKLGFRIDPADRGARSGELRELLGGVPPARLFDETLKLFLTGHGAAQFRGAAAARAAGGAAAHRGCLSQRAPGQPGRAAAGARAAQYRRARAGRQTGHADLPVRTAPVWADRRRSSRRCRPSGGTSSRPFSMPATGRCARRRRISPFRGASRWACARCSRCSRGSSIRAGRRALRVLEHPRFRAAYDLLLLRAAIRPGLRRDGAVVDPAAGSLGGGARPDGRRAAQASGPRSRRVANGGGRRRRPSARGARPRAVVTVGAWRPGSPPISGSAAICRIREPRSARLHGAGSACRARAS